MSKPKDYHGAGWGNIKPFIKIWMDELHEKINICLQGANDNPMLTGAEMKIYRISDVMPSTIESVLQI